MTDKPIIFSAPMVRALLDGRKTQTRRVLKPQPDAGQFFGRMRYLEAQNLLICRNATGMRQDIPIPYAPGDRLWVRECWRTASAYDDLSPSQMGGEEPIRYEADQTWQTWGWGRPHSTGRHRAARHMPRWASRLTLLVTDVRVQRLQEIIRGDAMEEGCPFANMADGPNPRDWYRDIWNSIHGPDAWDANPWVAAISFDVQRGNIDDTEVGG